MPFPNKQCPMKKFIHFNGALRWLESKALALAGVQSFSFGLF
ncbi:hypothetical protein BGP_3324 [Beggiatoa sp. PS]|nr:hypothetical protein BGP_3324 [Beggiatoa sp. PS]